MSGIGLGLGIPLGGSLGWTPMMASVKPSLWLKPESLGNPNRLLRTEALTHAAWTKTTTTVTGGETDPDGGSTAFKIVDGGAGGSVTQSAVGFQAGDADIGNLWYKKVSGGNGTLRMQDGTDDDDIALSSATWVQVSRTHTLNAGATKSEIAIILAATSEIHVWHPQLESGSTVTTYHANVATAGGIVAQWDDSSLNGNHATQGTQASMPLVASGALNGKNGALFDGVDDYLVTTISSLTQPFEVFLVFALNSTGAFDKIFTGHATGYIDYPAANVLRAYDFTDVRTVGAVMPNDGTYVLASVRFSDTAGQCRIAIDGTENVTGTGTGTSFGNTQNIMATLVPGNYGSASLVEQLVFSSVISSGDRTNLLAYFAGRYPTLGL